MFSFNFQKKTYITERNLAFQLSKKACPRAISLGEHLKIKRLCFAQASDIFTAFNCTFNLSAVADSTLDFKGEKKKKNLH